MDKVKFEFYKGRTYTRDFTITGYNDSIDEIYFTTCEDVNNKNYCLRKTLTCGGITVVDSGTDEEGNNYTTYNLLIEATDTDHMKIDYEYGFDIAIISGTKKTEVIIGILQLKGTYTKTCNEC